MAGGLVSISDFQAESQEFNSHFIHWDFFQSAFIERNEAGISDRAGEAY